MQIEQEGLIIQPSYLDATEVSNWCEEFNLRTDELLDILHYVGPNITEVRDFIAKRSIRSEAPF